MQHRPITAQARADPPGEATSLELDALAGHWRLVLAIALAFATLAAGYALLRTPLYESKVQLLVETGGLTLFRDEPVVVPAPVLPNLLETQVRLIAARGTALAVVDALHLADDPEFVPRPSLRARFGLAAAPADDAEARRERAATGLLDRLRANSLGLSNVVELGVTSRDPAKAATLANAVAAAYRQRLDAAAADRARGASAWVRQRLQTSGTHARVISEATPAAAATGTRGALIVAAALVAGALAGAAAAILLALLRPAARSPDQLAACLGADCLATLPFAEPPAILDAPAAPYARALRQLAASLEDLRRDRPLLLGLASPEPGEGASTLATNLAQLLALQGRQVMLVDANADAPSITRAFDLARAPGLAEALRGAAPEEITVVSDPRSGLDILPLGAAPATGGSLFHLPAAADLATRLRASYEFVLVDLPPILASPDPRAAAGFLDALLLVLDARPKPHRHLRETLARAGRSRARIVGFVVNRPAPRPGRLARLFPR